MVNAVVWERLAATNKEKLKNPPLRFQIISHFASIFGNNLEKTDVRVLFHRDFQIISHFCFQLRINREKTHRTVFFDDNFHIISHFRSILEIIWKSPLLTAFIPRTPTEKVNFGNGRGMKTVLGQKASVFPVRPLKK